MGNTKQRAPSAPAVHTSRDDDADRRQQVGMTKKEEGFIRKLGYNPKSKLVREQWQNSKRNTLKVANERRR